MAASAIEVVSDDDVIILDSDDNEFFPAFDSESQQRSDVAPRKDENFSTGAAICEEHPPHFEERPLVDLVQVPDCLHDELLQVTQKQEGLRDFIPLEKFPEFLLQLPHFTLECALFQLSLKRCVDGEQIPLPFYQSTVLQLVTDAKKQAVIIEAFRRVGSGKDLARKLRGFRVAAIKIYVRDILKGSHEEFDLTMERENETSLPQFIPSDYDARSRQRKCLVGINNRLKEIVGLMTVLRENGFIATLSVDFSDPIGNRGVHIPAHLVQWRDVRRVHLQLPEGFEYYTNYCRWERYYGVASAFEVLQNDSISFQDLSLGRARRNSTAFVEDTVGGAQSISSIDISSNTGAADDCFGPDITTAVGKSTVKRTARNEKGLLAVATDSRDRKDSDSYRGRHMDIRRGIGAADIGSKKRDLVTQNPDQLLVPRKTKKRHLLIPPPSPPRRFARLLSSSASDSTDDDYYPHRFGRKTEKNQKKQTAAVSAKRTDQQQSSVTLRRNSSSARSTMSQQFSGDGAVGKHTAAAKPQKEQEMAELALATIRAHRDTVEHLAVNPGHASNIPSATVSTAVGESVGESICIVPVPDNPFQHDRQWQQIFGFRDRANAPAGVTARSFLESTGELIYQLLHDRKFRETTRNFFRTTGVEPHVKVGVAEFCFAEIAYRCPESVPRGLWVPQEIKLEEVKEEPI